MSDSEEETRKRRTKKNVSIMLWGKKKASQSQIDEVLKTPIKTTKKEPKTTKKGVKTVKEQRTHYDPTLEYTVDDIDFLEQELEKINDDYENQKFDRLEDKNVKKYFDIKKLEDMEDDQKEDIMYKVIDKLERLVEVLKDYKGDTKGEGLDTDSEEEDNKRMEKKIAKKESKKPKKEVKKETPKQTTKVTSSNKARAEKGSDEAKAKMAKLTAIRQAKKAEKDKEKEKEKQQKTIEKESKKKPYFYIGPLPKGYRKATEDEALLEEMFTEYGENQIDPVKLKYFEKYHIVVSSNKSPNQIIITLRGLTKRADRIFTDIDILESKYRSAKSNEDALRLKDRIEQRLKLNKDYKKTEEYKRFKAKLKELVSSDYAKGVKQELTDKKQELKDITKIYRFYQKVLISKTGKDMELLKEFKRKEPEYVPPPPTVKKVIEKKELPLTPMEEMRQSLLKLPRKTKEPIKTTHTFENTSGEVEIPKKFFDDKMVLHPKYAEKLHKKDILLHPHHYDEDYTKKYFYTHVKGKGIGVYDLQKLLQKSYDPILGNVGDYMLDDELSTPTTQVYRNRNTDKIYVVHRGTKEASDWLNNFVYGLSPKLYTYTSRYKNAKNTQEKALDKYQGYDIDVLGHSQGAKLAELLSKDNKNIKNVITYNRPQGLIESLYPKNDNLYDIKTTKDLVSVFVPLQGGNDPNIIKSKSNNPVKEHLTDPLKEIPDEMIGTGFVNRKPDLNHNSITQSVVFEKPLWTKARALRWLKENKYYHDDVDVKKTQIRFRQYNPEDFYNYHYISKPLKDKGILLIIAMKNAVGGTVYRSITKHIPYTQANQEYKFEKHMEKHGEGFMVNNVEHFTPTEALLKNTKLITNHVQDAIKEHKALAKEAKTTLKRTAKMNKSSLKRAVKGSQEVKDRMARLRALKKK